ncbi:MAG: efflux RND transporter permease subunit [Polyangiales bacterium]
MTLSEICVRRPVFATMLVSACVAFGVLSFGKLGVDQYPDVDLPVVTVQTVLRGASPEEIETQVTKPIEDAISTSQGIDELTSTSVEGLSSVTVRFLLERNADQATQDVRDKVSAIIGNLPEGTDSPVITRLDTTAIPVATLVVEGNRDLRELTDLAEHQVMEPLEGLSGVGEIQMLGGRKRAFQIEVDATAMAERGLTVGALRTAIASQNIEVPGGRVQRDGREDVLRTVARARNRQDLLDLVVAEYQGAPVRLRDIATVTDSEEEPRSLARLNGRNAVSLVVQKQSGTNTVRVVDTLRARIAELEESLPDDVHITVVRDTSRFIRRSIHEVEVHLVLGGLLASLAVLLFMGSLRSTFIAAIAIPSSIVTTFAILRALDYTLNNFTLLALTLAVGVVIDDAIVVLENVFRHVEKGQDPFQAAIDGTKEITLAVFATTLSLIVIFLPTAFMEGMVGRFWRSFGVTTAFAIGISLFVSLTLTPMLCSKMLKPPPAGHGEAEKKGLVAKLNDVLDRSYGWLVGWSLRHRWLVVLISVACIAAIVPLGGRVGKDFIPQDDSSEFTIALTMPEGTDLQAASALASEIEERIRALRGVELLWTRVGSGRGEDVGEVEMYVGLVDLEKRTFSQRDVMGAAREVLAAYPELRPVVSSLSGLAGGGRNTELMFSLRGPDLAELDRLSEEMTRRMRADSGFVDVDTASAVRKPELRIVVDRQRAADLGVRAGEVASSLRTMVGGEAVTKIREGAEQYDVWLRLRPIDRGSEIAISMLPIASQRGIVRLDAVADLVRDRGPAQINRYGRVRKVDINANLSGIPLGTAVDRVNQIAAEMELPPGYEVTFSGRAKILKDTFGSFLAALGMSFLFMYMVLAAQFESFLHPITIMLSLPLSLPFALVSLLLLHDTLNIYSAFGMFMLFGIVKKNGILQVDYTNTLRSRGVERERAIVEANVTRLRPILMTTITLVMGMIPLALGQGPGAASRASMAKVIIGGQALSLVITLLIVPVAYSLFDDAGRWWDRVRSRRKDDVEAVAPAE